MGERYTASSTMFAKRVQRGEKEVVAVDVDEDADDDHVGGGGATRRRFRQRFPPPILADGGQQTLFRCF